MTDYAAVDREAKRNAEEYQRLNADQWMPWGTDDDAFMRHANNWWAIFDGWTSWYLWGDELI